MDSVEVDPVVMLKIRIHNDNQNEEVMVDQSPYELGRGPKKELDRFVILDSYVSRDQIRIRQDDERHIHLTNLGSPIYLEDGVAIERDEALELQLPCRLSMGFTELKIEWCNIITGQSAGGQGDDPEDRFSTINISRMTKAPDVKATLSEEMISQWVESLIRVQTAAANSGQFFGEAARAVVELIGLDKGIVLVRKGNKWTTVAHFPPVDSLDDARFSTRVVSNVVEHGLTFWQTANDQEDFWCESLRGIESVVASPVFDADESIIGVIYGARSMNLGDGMKGIQALEARFVHLLASVVGSGLALSKKEAEIARHRVQFEQFASPQVVDALERHPDLLKGQECDVTVMFCDLRGFSGISERLGPQELYRFLGDVMGMLTEVIFNHSGVIIDYHGDGLAAMWNAPVEQPHHAEMACNAAVRVHSIVEEINQVWGRVIDIPIRFGVGINSGKALVGNAGSPQRIKYGPQGHTVSLASRVEGATKFFGVTTLVTEPTVIAAAVRENCRRLGKILAVGMHSAVNVYELPSNSDTNEWNQVKETYERALESMEADRENEAILILRSLEDDPAESSDYPTRVLYRKCLELQHATVDQRSTIFVLDQK